MFRGRLFEMGLLRGRARISLSLNYCSTHYFYYTRSTFTTLNMMEPCLNRRCVLCNMKFHDQDVVMAGKHMRFSNYATPRN